MCGDGESSGGGGEGVLLGGVGGGEGSGIPAWKRTVGGGSAKIGFRG